MACILSMVDQRFYEFKALDGDPLGIKYVERYVKFPSDIGSDFVLTPRIITGGGAPVRWDDAPTKGRMGGPRRKLEEYMMMFSLLLVGERFREIIERFEPGVHQFFPIDVVWKDGSLAGRHYFFNIVHTLDALDPDHTTLIRYPDTPNFFKLKLGDPEHKAVYSVQRMLGHHIWVERRLPNVISTSAELGAALKQAKLKGLDFYEIEQH